MHGWNSNSLSDSKSEFQSPSKLDEAKTTTTIASLSLHNVNCMHVKIHALSDLLKISCHVIDIWDLDVGNYFPMYSNQPHRLLPG